MTATDNQVGLPMFVADSPRAPACDAFRHPLEIFPFFRRLPPSFARNVVYTLSWNSLFALFFTSLSIMIDLSASLVESLRITRPLYGVSGRASSESRARRAGSLARSSASCDNSGRAFAAHTADAARSPRAAAISASSSKT